MIKVSYCFFCVTNALSSSNPCIIIIRHLARLSALFESKGFAWVVKGSLVCAAPLKLTDSPRFKANYFDVNTEEVRFFSLICAYV